MVREGLESALMEGVELETVVFCLYYALSIIFLSKLLGSKIEYCTILGARVVCNEKSQMIDLDALLLLLIFPLLLRLNTSPLLRS